MPLPTYADPTLELIPPPPLEGAVAAMARATQPPLYWPAEDTSIDVHDGSRAIEVTTLFGDLVLKVSHLSAPRPWQAALLTWIIGAIGGLLVATGAVLIAVAQLGTAALLLPLGLGFVVYAGSRVRAERGSPMFCIGEAPEADLHVSSSALPSSCFPLVEARSAQSGGQVLSFSPAMSGEVALPSGRWSLAGLAQSGQAWAGELPGTYCYAIPDDARITLAMGEATVLISAVSPAKRLAGPLLARVDWAKQRFTGLSLGIHAAVLILVLLVPPDGRALSPDSFEVDSRFLPYRLLPVQVPDHDPAAWLRRQRGEQPAGGAPKAAGPRGRMGSPTARQHNRRFGIKGQAPNSQFARELARQAASKAGVVGLLGRQGNSRLAAIFGSNTALGADAEEALGNLIGNEIGESWGSAGGDLRDWGRGGGGNATGVIGFDGYGTRGKGGPGGPGGYGPGGGTARAQLGHHEAKAPAQRAIIFVKGALDKSLIRRVVRQHLSEVRYCYERELQANPHLSGRVVVRFVIGGTGQVASAVTESSTVQNRDIEGCMTSAVRRWLFPQPQGGGTVIVSYPFLLRSVDGT